jgi:hypothetical protein
MIGQSEPGSSSQIIFITLLLQVHSFAVCLLPASANCAKLMGQNNFAEPKWHDLTFLHSSFNVQGHMLSTSGLGIL